MEKIFINRRMDHLQDELLRVGLWKQEDKMYERVRKVIVDELSNHTSKPSLLHGDLWEVTTCS